MNEGANHAMKAMNRQDIVCVLRLWFGRSVRRVSLNSIPRANYRLINAKPVVVTCFDLVLVTILSYSGEAMSHTKKFRSGGFFLRN